MCFDFKEEKKSQTYWVVILMLLCLFRPLVIIFFMSNVSQARNCVNIQYTFGRHKRNYLHSFEKEYNLE